ncbi:MAG: hypothetical protein Ct9H300mP32_7080 [Verrucomicrobiota bacterium]|nr:MAG: hypothetical protein Ct9H300mP32_7080 [Verrucomicrobiota bacterium]
MKDGTIIGPARRVNLATDFLSKKRFRDFVVKAKFRVLHGDSGFYFRVDRVKSGVRSTAFGFEVDETDETGACTSPAAVAGSTTDR